MKAHFCVLASMAVHLATLSAGLALATVSQQVASAALPLIGLAMLGSIAMSTQLIDRVQQARWEVRPRNVLVRANFHRAG
jgi:hypothetical protein